MIFSALADLTTACENYGQILTVDPSRFHITDKVSESAVVGVKSMAILHAVVNFGDEEYMELIKSVLECELISEITHTRASCSVERRERNQYEISYQPTIKGRHQLHIKVGGQHVRGSPSSVAVKSPVEKLGSPILIIDGVEGPKGVAVNQRGEVVVTERGEYCVTMFSPSDKKLRSFGTCGSGPGQLRNPRGVAVDCEGNILVADNFNNRIQKFTEEGQFIVAVVSNHGKSPTDIAFNYCNNKVYVVYRNSNQIQILNSDLTLSSTFGKSGNGKGQLDGPWGIACDSTGNVYVTELHNRRIQVFTVEGKFIRMFGRHGHIPFYVAVDSRGMVYASEHKSHFVSAFTTEGQYAMSFGKRGVAPGAFEAPYGLAVDNNGVVYVCNSGNSRVQVY